MKRTLWISATALALLCLTCAAFARLIEPTTNQGSVSATPFGATLNVNVTVS